ncbi:protein sprouty [Periplaneta americana]|uniref:protein sprouty n=1 Tax=Periplaneta americana TaxID=6978 RepID=UPI0037E79E7B
MAQHGGLAQQQPPQGAEPPPRPPVPRVHRPRLAIMTPPPPTTIILQPLGTAATTPASSRRRPQQQAAPPAAAAEVTLAAPRPDGERTVNEYVETPFRPAAASEGAPVRKSESTRRDPPHHQALHLPIGGGGTHGGAPTPVTKQPVTFKKDAAPRPGVGGGDTTPASGAGTSGTTSGDCFRGSIICPECGRCRCESCRQPRPLPSRWLCNNACFCSAETSLDYASCLCCVKGLFYHCSKDYEDGATGSCADDPCSCGPHRLLARWGCLAALSLALPCLWCYWPLRGCVGLCEKCYARYSSQGCRCEPRRAPKLSDVTPEKRLLDSSPDF